MLRGRAVDGWQRELETERDKKGTYLDGETQREEKGPYHLQEICPSSHSPEI